MILKYLNQYSDKFLQNRNAIIHDWLEHQEVKNIFKHYNINLGKFKLQFAHQIFDYYINIFEKKSNTNEYPPIIIILLNYLNQQKVSHDEVFVICSNFRKAMTKFTYKEKIASEELLDELNVISDKSIKDIIKHFHLISKDDENSFINKNQEIELSSMLFKYSNDAVVITDKENKIVMINKQFTNLTGYTIDEIEGKNPQYFSTGWGDSAFYKDMWLQIVNNGIYKGEVWDKKKSGETYAAALTILSVKNDKGKITNYIGISNDITANKNYQKRIEQLSYYDNLTKLPNRVHFKEKVKSYMASYNSHQTKCAIIIIDMDNFKWINDSLGHKFGNDVLIIIASRIKTIINEQSFFSRMGGDEFAILMPYKSILEVNNLARKIHNTTNKSIKILDKEITFGLSLGISMFPENGLTYAKLLQNADTAMYQAKANGKNNFVYFTHEMNENSLKRLDIDTNLHQAIKNNSFSIVYQPKISLKTKKVYGMEVLIRWNDPVLGFISPDIFIPIAEESKLIEEIGYWVIEKSLEEFSTILPHANNDLLMSINISAKQFNDKNFLQKTSYIIQRSKINPENIEFEITETAIMDNIDSILEILKQIKALGISISIDDFGTGHSSMAYLKKLPIDTIKIDRTFIKDIDFDNGDKAITNAIVTMSKQLGLKTIAEGIETIEHERIVQEIGVDNAQGYLYSKGVSSEEFIKFIQVKE